MDKVSHKNSCNTMAENLQLQDSEGFSSGVAADDRDLLCVKFASRVYRHITAILVLSKSLWSRIIILEKYTMRL